jgi:uncharacterized delta-60 repeat protein
MRFLSQKTQIFLFFLFTSGTLALPAFAQTPVLDSTFGTNGVTLIDIDTNFGDQAKAMVIRKDGKILVGGTSEAPDIIFQYSLAMARLNADGSFDNSFGTGGKMRINWAFTNGLEDMTIDSSGRIVASGNEVVKTDFSEYHPVIYRFHSDGTPDSSFGTNGRTVQDYDTASNGYASTVFIGQKGRLFGVGACSKPSQSFDQNTGFGAFALDSNGILDTSYHHSGIALIPKPIGEVSAQFGFGGKIFMASRTARKDFYQDSSFVLFARFNPDGTPDTKLGPEGVTQLPYVIAHNTFDTKVILTDPISSHFIFGFNTNPDGDSLRRLTTLVRWNNALGIVDPTFGTGGSVNIQGGRSNEVYDCINDTSIKKIYTAGYTFIGNNQLGLILRLNEDGSIDQSFANQGAFVAPRGITSGATHFVKIIPIEKGFYILGQDDSTHGTDMFVAKYKMPVASVKTASNSPSFSLYPNPANTNLTIECIGTENKISISDELGREITTFTSREQSIHYDISQLASGVYCCTVESAAGKEIKKFIVSH